MLQTQPRSCLSAATPTIASSASPCRYPKRKYLADCAISSLNTTTVCLSSALERDSLFSWHAGITIRKAPCCNGCAASQKMPRLKCLRVASTRHHNNDTAVFKGAWRCIRMCRNAFKIPMTKRARTSSAVLVDGVPMSTENGTPRCRARA